MFFVSVFDSLTIFLFGKKKRISLWLMLSWNRTCTWNFLFMTNKVGLLEIRSLIFESVILVLFFFFFPPEFFEALKHNAFFLSRTSINKAKLLSFHNAVEKGDGFKCASWVWTGPRYEVKDQVCKEKWKEEGEAATGFYITCTFVCSFVIIFPFDFMNIFLHLVSVYFWLNLLFLP